MNEIEIQAKVATVDCWSCGAEFIIASAIRLTRGDEIAECDVADFTEFPRLATTLSDHLSAIANLGPLKIRHSATVGGSYFSNGCAHCDALFGRHFEIATRNEERLGASFTVAAVDGWGKMLDDLVASDDGHLF